MKLERLLKILDQANHEGLSITGRYGVISAHPDGMRHPQTGESTYQVEAEYQQAGSDSRTRVRQRGFRFSTVCCLCAAVCMGESRLDHGVLAAINEHFAGSPS